MEITDRDKDRFVVLSLKPEWGRGKIRSVKEGKAQIIFESDPERKERPYPLYSEFLSFAKNQDAASFKGRVKGVRKLIPKSVPKEQPSDEPKME